MMCCWLQKLKMLRADTLVSLILSPILLPCNRFFQEVGPHSRSGLENASPRPSRRSCPSTSSVRCIRPRLSTAAWPHWPGWPNSRSPRGSKTVAQLSDVVCELTTALRIIIIINAAITGDVPEIDTFSSNLLWLTKVTGCSVNCGLLFSDSLRRHWKLVSGVVG